MEDTSRHNVPDDAGDDLGQKLDGDVQGVQVSDFLHHKSKPEVGGEEGHHSEDGSAEKLEGGG